MTSDSRPTTILIEPSRGWASFGMKDVWQYRDLLYFMFWRDVKARYRQTALGPLWYIIGPVMRMVVFTFVFGSVAQLPSEGIPYPVFTYTAVLPWELFAGAIRGSSGSLVGFIRVISKAYFPRLIVPLSAALSGLVDFLVSLAILCAMAWYFGFAPTIRWFVLPAYVLLALGIGLGVGLWLATLAVAFRDVMQFLNWVITFWMYMTPVAYSAELISERWKLLYTLNPMYWVVEGFRWVVLDRGAEPGVGVVIAWGAMLILLTSGTLVFRRMERSIVDLL